MERFEGKTGKYDKNYARLTTGFKLKEKIHGNSILTNFNKNTSKSLDLR